MDEIISEICGEKKISVSEPLNVRVRSTCSQWEKFLHYFDNIYARNGSKGVQGYLISFC